MQITKIPGGGLRSVIIPDDEGKEGWRLLKSRLDIMLGRTKLGEEASNELTRSSTRRQISD